MDFFLYDNIHTYTKRFPQAKFYPETDLLVKQVAITPWNSFLFETDFKREDTNIDINAPYVHIHPGLKSITKMRFDKDPYYIDMKSVVYDPKEKLLKIYKPGSSSWNPFRKPIFVKNVKGRYYGSELPLRKIKTLGDWKYDLSMKTMHIILNYYGGHRSATYDMTSDTTSN